MKEKAFDINQISDEAFIVEFFNSVDFKDKIGVAKEEKIVIDQIKVFKRFYSKSKKLISIVVRYKVSYDGKREEMFGIAHCTGLWKPIYRYQKHLYSSGFDSGKVKTNKPIGYYDHLKTLFYYNAPGIPLIEAIEKGGINLKSVFLDVGKGLGKLHSVPPKEAPRYDLQKEKGMFVDYSAYVLRESNLKSASDVLELVKEIYDLEKQYQEKITFTHGDFHPKNIIVDNGDIYFIDFSNAVLFERESDVGDFLAQFSKGYFGFDQEKLLGKKKIKKLENLFLEGYFSVIKEDTYTKNAISLYKAKTLIKIIIHILHWEDFKNEKEQKLILENTKEAQELIKAI